MKTKKNLLCFVPLLLASLLLSGCDWGFPGDREGCGGFPFVASDVLPDTVRLQVEGPPFSFDLEEAPVFEHTAEKLITYRISSTGQAGVVRTSIGFLTGKLELYPIGVGTAHVKVWAEDDCEKWDTLGAFVQVTNPATCLSNTSTMCWRQTSIGSHKPGHG